jgi:hypothetical protein
MEQQQNRSVPREYRPLGLGSKRRVQTLDGDLAVVSGTVMWLAKSQ